MAFQARRQRQVSTSRAQLAPTATAQSSLAPSLFTPDTEEWVVFSPSAVAGSSEVASILTASSPVNERHFTDFPTASDDELELEVEEEEAEEDEEVESSCALTETDSLQPFRDGVHAPILLPTHNGLGMFQSTTTSRSFEESLRLAAQGGPTDTHSRIQKWRMEQGSVLMDEIEKATRRRRESLSRRSAGGTSQLKLVKSAGEEEEAIIASLANLATPEDELIRDPLATRSVRETQGTLGSEDEPQTDEELEQEKEDRENETFWTRITRTFIRDIIGIDDRLLEVILGETLPNTPTQAGTSNNIPASEDRILSRIAKELGELVHLYTHPADSPPAFTAAAVANRNDIEDGAGAKTPIAAGEQTKQSQRPSHQRTISTTSQTASSGIHFLPTLPSAEFNLLDENPTGSSGTHSGTHSTTPSTRRQDYWEQDLDMRLVFSFLKSKFNGLHRSGSSTSVNTAHTTSTTNTTATATAAAAAVSTPVHLQHPLIDRRRHPGSLRTGPVEARVDSPQVTGGYFSNPGSCARSERTRSGRASTRRGGYYWEVASSVSGKTGSCAGVGMWAAI
ncbi:hypothetical protein FPQ18DRAFT_98005 [Pyronema domesticum]|uniref:Uncharacterized protein n=1 Tax=Pyronema omphalodes (strain CBS 100304) TaxID=1076935 RepID=U4LNF3_PYROM|nr:hypothetical protein FPQ18DRAFT_98005 [Pyronema domesticum]CCX33478.1 Protein of unknown function [Pyronema omphalodes CBS 100304]